MIVMVRPAGPNGCRGQHSLYAEVPRFVEAKGQVITRLRCGTHACALELEAIEAVRDDATRTVDKSATLET